VFQSFLDGASPSDASRLIARPLETRLRSVPGIQELSSSARLSYARIVAEFEVGYDIDTALNDINKQLKKLNSSFLGKQKILKLENIHLQCFQ